MKFWKRLLTMLLAIILVFSLVACDSDDDVPPPADDGGDDETAQAEEKAIDIYLIAGQSNAAGYSKVTNASSLYSSARGLKGGYEHILYSGTALVGGSEGSPTVYTKDWCPTTIGCGRGADYIGPEAGMAAALSSYYDEKSDKYAGIIKYAQGGTSLLDKSSGNNAYGNWASPSYIAALGLSGAEANDNTGRLYREFLDQVYKSLKALEDYGGFNKINIKGLYWMQGCNDRGDNANDPLIYPRAMRYFAEDIRRDLADMLTLLTDSDCGASTMPIIIGTLSNTYNSASQNEINTYNIPFVEMQKALPQTISNCYVLDNSEFAINRWDTISDSNVVLGTDKSHWSAADALAIGKNLGALILENILK